MKIVKLLFFSLTLILFSFAGISQNTSVMESEGEVLSPSILIDKLSDKVDETSGLIFFRGSLWTLNDSGGKPQIYRLDKRTGKVVQVVTLKNIKNKDFEALTHDDDYIYISDVGNNFGNRKDLCIYKIAKKDIPKKADVSLKSEQIKIAYADQVSFQKKNLKNNYDCEAIISAGDKLYLFTKNWIDAKTRVYAVPKEAGEYNLKVVDEFPVNGLITAAEYDVETGTLSLLGYENFMPFLWVFWDFQDQDFFGGAKRRFNFESIHGAQTEGICLNDDGDVLISCEQSYFPQRLYSIPLKSLISDTFYPNSEANKELELLASYDAKKEIIHLQIKGLKKGSYTVEILNRIWRSESDFSFKAKNKGEENVALEVKNLKAGMYYLRVEQKKLSKVSRVNIN